MWTARSFAEAMGLYFSGGCRAEPEPLRVSTAPPVAFVDLSELHPDAWRKLKLGSRRRPLAAVEPYRTIHVTAVVGGYGASKRASKRVGSVKGAIAERYAKLAYHDLASRNGGGTDYKIHPPERRTAHGGEGNKGMGWAIDCGNRETLPPSLRDAGVVSLSRSLREQREYSDQPIIVVPHRVWTPQRMRDTDVIVWRVIVLPVLQALGHDVARAGYEVIGRKKKCRPIPRIWDPDALYDDKGRLL